MIKRIKDPVSSLTHLLGAALSVPCTVFLIIRACGFAVWHVVSFAVFGAALFLLYTASGVYHMLSISEKATSILRRIDHMMIFVLIAGTYTPICLIPLRGAWGFTLFGLVWGLAGFGIALKALWLNAPRKLSTAVYLIMGWIVIIAFYPLVKALPIGAVVLLVAGGVSYSLGAVIYALKWPSGFKFFGFHELFHLFVLGGSALHIILMFRYISDYA